LGVYTGDAIPISFAPETKSTFIHISPMKNLPALYIAALAVLIAWNAQAETEQTIRNTCNSNIRTHNRSIPMNTSQDGQTTVTISERGGYTFTLPALAAKNGPVKGVKVALGKNPSGAALYVAPLTANKQAEFKDVEPGTYRVFLIPATKEQVPVKEAPAMPTGKLTPNASKTEVVPATPNTKVVPVKP
jgi:hypothetical protein